MTEETLSSNSSENNTNKNSQVPLSRTALKHISFNPRSVLKSSVKHEHLLNKTETKPTSSSSFSWPSLWKNGPRRSAFQPYKPSRDAPSTSNARPSTKVTAERLTPTSQSGSATVMTNLQRGNMQTPATPTNSMCWFTLCGRGDVLNEDLKEMVAQGKDVDMTDDEGMSGMMWAAFHGQIHTVQIFLEFGVEVDRQGMWGETALMLAATEGHLEIVRMLLSAGANVNHEDHVHATALMCAVYNDHPHTVHELLLNGADVTVVNSGNSTAHSLSVDMKSYKAKAVLENHIVSLAEKTMS